MATQQLDHLTRRPPLGDLPVSPTATDENQRDLLFPPWLDALPTPPHHHSNTSVLLSPPSLGAPTPSTNTRVQIFEDVQVTRQGDFNSSGPQRQCHNDQDPVIAAFNPDTPPKTPEINNNHNTAKRKRDPHDDGTPKRSAEGTLKNPKSMKSLQESSSGSLLRLNLLSLSPTQLVKIVTGLVESNPDLQKELESQLPEPDLSNQLKSLSHLMHNVYRALPRTRIGSTRGALCYRRVRVHLSAFKKCCLQQGRHLVRCCSWKAAIEYSLAAWQYTANLPVWDNPAHNRIRECCFQGLAAMCIKALKHGQLDKKTLVEFRTRMQTASIVDNVMDLCINRLDSRLETL